MSSKLSKILSTAIISGLLAGSAMAAENAAPADANKSVAATEKDKNGCKGKDKKECKADDKNCCKGKKKDKNSCSGKDGCKGKDKKEAAPKAQ